MLIKIALQHFENILEDVSVFSVLELYISCRYSPSCKLIQVSGNPCEQI